jgi:putative membrane protein
MFLPIIRTALVLLLLAWLLPTVGILDWVTLLIASVVITILFSLIRPLLNLLLLPINIVTLGFFSTIINTLLLYTALYLVPGFTITPMIIFGMYLNQFFSIMLISFAIGCLMSIVKKLI